MALQRGGPAWGFPSWETTPPEALQMHGGRVALGVIAERPEPHWGGSTLILPPPWGDHLPRAQH